MANKPVKKAKVTKKAPKRNDFIKQINTEEVRKVDNRVNNAKKTTVKIIVIAVLLVLIVLITKCASNKEKKLVEIAKEYVTAEKIKIDKTLTISAKELEDAGYDTKLNADCQKESKVMVKVVDKENEYTAEVICLNDLKPIITLKGDKTITLTTGDKYTEQGATAKLGSEDITKDIKIDDSDLETDKEGTYKIVYNIEASNGKKVSIERTVKVVDEATDDEDKDTDDQTQAQDTKDIKIGDIITVTGNGNGSSDGKSFNWTRKYEKIEMKVIKINEGSAYPYALNQYGKGTEGSLIDITGWFNADSITK